MSNKIYEKYNRHRQTNKTKIQQKHNNTSTGKLLYPGYYKVEDGEHLIWCIK